MKSIVSDLLITKENFVTESKKFKQEIVKFGVPGREIITGSILAPTAPVKFYWKVDGSRNFVLATDGSKIAESAYELADTKSGKLSAEGLSDFQFDRQSYADKHQLYVTHADSLLAHLFSRISPASLATLETQATYRSECAAVNTLALWNLLESTHLHGSSRQKNMMMSQFLAFRQTGSHEEFLSTFNDMATRVLSAFEDPTAPGFISFDVLMRSTYLSSVDQSFFLRHIDMALEDATGVLGTTQAVQALFQQYYLERGPVTTTSFSSGALVASIPAASKKSSPVVPKRGAIPGVCPSTHCSHCWSKGYANAHDLAVCRWRLRGSQVLVAETPVAPTPGLVHDEAFIAAYQSSYGRYEASLARVGRPLSGVPLALPPSAPSSFCAFGYLSDISVPFYYDNAASVSLVSNLCFFALGSVCEVAPFFVGGVSAGVNVTHSGRLPWLPPSVNLAYFAPALPVCLFSLGYLQSQGGNYSTVGATSAGGPSRLDVFLPDGSLLDKAVVGTNRLAAVSPALYAASASASFSEFGLGAHISSCSPNGASHGPAWASWNSPSHPAPVSLVQCCNCPQVFAALPLHVNAEQRGRCDRAEALHQGVAGHASDDVLAEALHTGRFRWADVTAADVRLNRRLRGLCPQCAEGKLHAKAMLPSTTEPASAVGETICFDIQLNKVKSPGGNLARLRSVDEFSGDVQSTPIASKDAASLVAGLLRLVHQRYNAYGHRVIRMVADSEPALKPVVGLLAAAAGIVLTLVDPGQHIQRAERTVQSIVQRKRAVLASLPYFLPVKYSLYAERWVCDVMNGLPNSRSRPSTADVLVTGRERSPHYAHPELSFGAVCMVRQFHPKRETLSRNAVEPQLVEDVPVAEVGVCLGYPLSVPGDFDFLLANGEIVPRRVVQIINLCPFDWAPRRVLRPLLPLSDPDPPLAPTLTAPQGPVQPVPAAVVLPQPVPAVVLPQRAPAVVLPPPVPAVVLSPPAPTVVLPQPAPAVVLPQPAPVALHPATLMSPPVPPVSLPSSLGVPSISSASSCVVDALPSLPPVPAPVSPVMPSPCTPVKSLPRTSSRPLRGSQLPAGFWHGAALAVSPSPPVNPLPEVLLANIASECAGFNTQRADEYDLDSLEALFSTTSAPIAAFSAPIALRVGSDELRPSPPTMCKEFPLRSALRTQALDKLIASTAVELTKQQTLGCLGTQLYHAVSDLPVDAGVVDAHVLYKDKVDGRSTCRIAGRGDRLPQLPDAPTHASVSSDGDKMLALALMQAHCASRSETLQMRDFDVVGGFLHIKRTSAVRLFLRLPSNLPHPFAGKLLEIFGALYGLRESNRLFSLEVARVLKSAGFVASCVSPMTFVKVSSADPNYKCVVSTHVDDFRALDNCTALTDSLASALESRFGKLTTHSPSTSFAGIEFSHLSNGAVVATQDKYFSRVADIVGVAHLPAVDIVAHPDFFQPSTLPSQLISVNIAAYQSLTGHLVQALKTRDDVRPYVSFLCSHNAAPCEGDYSRALHVLRYLHSTKGIGRVFSSTDTNIFAHSDASFASNLNGCSTGAYFLSVGAANAPFISSAKAQADVATCPMTAEYYSASDCCKALIHYRQLSTDLGWKHSKPTVLFLDNRTAISLVRAPEVTRKARHIAVQYHYIRQLFSRRVISVVHVSSDSQRADVMTKYMPRPMFQRKRAALLNSCSSLLP